MAGKYFTGFEIPLDVAQSIAYAVAAKTPPHCFTTVPPENYHVTHLYLGGNQKGTGIGPLPTGPIKLILGPNFDSFQRAGVVWLRADFNYAGASAFMRPGYTPHMTVLKDNRVMSSEMADKLNRDYPSAPRHVIEVDHLTLFRTVGAGQPFEKVARLDFCPDNETVQHAARGGRFE